MKLNLAEKLTKEKISYEDAYNLLVEKIKEEETEEGLFIIDLFEYIDTLGYNKEAYLVALALLGTKGEITNILKKEKDILKYIKKRNGLEWLRYISRKYPEDSYYFDTDLKEHLLKISYGYHKYKHPFLYLYLLRVSYYIYKIL